MADGRALVAIVALHRGMGAEERKTILMIVDLFCGDLPAQNGVTLRAVRSHFPLMDISVAILTGLADVGEYRLGMALDASHFFMHAAQGILGFAMVKLWDCSDGPPGRSRVAVFAGDGKRSVRTSSSLPLSGGSWNPRKLAAK